MFWLMYAVQQELDVAFPNPSDIYDQDKFMKVRYASSRTVLLRDTSN